MCDSFHPPNGWNCRCSVTQVRKSKYPATPHNEAMALGEIATQRDTRQMFRFNPGKEQKTFPNHNPYSISRCRNCDIAIGKLDLAKPYIPQNEMCIACKLVHACYKDKTIHLERQRIEANRKLYERLSKDKKYKDVEFNPINGGLKATHLGHNEGSDPGFVFEKKLIDMLYNCGHSVILCDEQKKDRDGKILSSLDIILDGVIMDIKSLTTNKKHYGSAIRGKNSQLVRFNHRSDVHEQNETLCLYFDDPSMYAPQKIKDGYEYMIVEKSKMRKKTGQPREIHLHRIICMINSSKGLEIKTFNFK